MMDAMDELVTWLRAQLDDDERGAPSIHDQDTCDNAIARGHDACICGWSARVLAEVEVKRRILDAYDAVRAEVREPASAEHRANARARQFALEQVIELLAQPYAGRDGWREEWSTH